MAKPIVYQEIEEIEFVNGIPGGLIRKGLSIFLLVIILMVALSFTIKVQKTIPVTTRFSTTQPVSVRVLPFASYTQTGTSIKETKQHNISISYGPHDSVTVIKRNFDRMNDSLFVFHKNTGLRLFFFINNAENKNGLKLGRQVQLKYTGNEAVINSRVINIINADKGNVYEIDTKQIPLQQKYSIMASKQSEIGTLQDVETSVFDQVYTNLFNKFKL